MYRSMQNSVEQRKERKKRRKFSGTRPAPGGWGSYGRGESPHQGKRLGQRGKKNLRLLKSEAETV